VVDENFIQPQRINSYISHPAEMIR